MSAVKMTPMMRQYQNLKQQYKDKVLLFRMGDFYETFGEDAKITSRVLNITLTARDKRADPTPLAGFPHHALDQYLPKLVQAGYNVAIADQVEDPKTAKGIVRREITRIVTPGTITEDKPLSEKQNNYLAAIITISKKHGLAVCDLSTGEFQITETENLQKLLDEVHRINPAEILIPPNTDLPSLSNFPLQIVDEFDLKYDTSKEIITSQLNVKSLSSFGIKPYQTATIAAGMIFHYLVDTQKKELSHIQSIQFFDLNRNMILDYATIRNLNLVSSEGELGSKGTVLSILDYTKTAMGGRTLRNWILHPLLDIKKIKFRHNCVEEFFSSPEILSQTQEQLKEISDIYRITGKIGLDRANARDLISLSNSIKLVLDLPKQLKTTKYLKKNTTAIETNKAALLDVIKVIDSAIMDEPPITIREGHIIKNGYDKKVDAIRNDTKDSRSWIKNLEKNERARTGISSLKVGFNKVFGYYIEITNTHKDKVPEEYTRKQTLVNCERYITQELKDKEDIVLNAEEKLAVLEYECFQEIRQEIIKSIKAIQKAGFAISQIDALSSLAEAARMNDYTHPEMYDFNENNGIVDIKNARHPIVEKHCDEEFISNNIVMNTGQNRLYILTGPNMSGKSTYIRQSALIILMAQAGSFVPASSAKISIADRIFTRVGASDDLSAGRSTFLVEMDEASNIINNATRHSFIVLDEIGRGTSTYDGVSIAWAIAEYIHNKVGARCMFATHYHELLKLESELSGVQNFNIAVLEEDNNITFLRKIEKGGTDKSYGIFVAQMAGLPDSLIERASEILTGFEQENMFGIRSNPQPHKTPSPKNIPPKPNTADTDQLSFMNSSHTREIPNIFKELKKLDVNKITPIDALKLIEKWKRKLGK